MAETFDDDEFAGFRFDEFLNLPAEHRGVLANELQPCCDDGRVRRRTAASQEKFELTLGLVIANALTSQRHPQDPACFYSRARGTYSERGAYNPRWLTYRILMGVIDPLRRVGLPRRMSKTKGYQLIEDHHHQIGGWFYKGRGLELMNDESDLCQRILTAGMNDGVVVLPVHDSFVVAEDREDWLRKRMIEVYGDRFGYAPLIH